MADTIESFNFDIKNMENNKYMQSYARIIAEKEDSKLNQKEVTPIDPKSVMTEIELPENIGTYEIFEPLTEDYKKDILNQQLELKKERLELKKSRKKIARYIVLAVFITAVVSILIGVGVLLSTYIPGIRNIIFELVKTKDSLIAFRIAVPIAIGFGGFVLINVTFTLPLSLFSYCLKKKEKRDEFEIMNDPDKDLKEEGYKGIDFTKEEKIPMGKFLEENNYGDGDYDPAPKKEREIIWKKDDIIDHYFVPTTKENNVDEDSLKDIKLELGKEKIDIIKFKNSIEERKRKKGIERKVSTTELKETDDDMNDEQIDLLLKQFNEEKEKKIEDEKKYIEGYDLLDN